MTSQDRRGFLRNLAGTAGATAALGVFPPAIQRALAAAANNETGTLFDVKHIVILMQENRSFDHYFGTLRGVRGFGDRFPIPLESGKSVWFQSDGTKEILPFHFDKTTMNAALIIDTPHNFPDMQAAWNQGKYGFWPKYKTAVSMGYYKRQEAPFQYALAEAFTICDAYHCSIATGTDPNRVAFWSGSNYDPARRAAGLDSDYTNAEVVNIRCWITGSFPTPGYTYYGSALPWKSIPEVLEEAGVSWRIYQDPNDNWTGAMNGALAFAGFRNAAPGSSIYRNGLSHWSLDDLRRDVLQGTLPAVSWICPSQLQSEHPGAPSSPERGGDFTQQVLEALTSSTETWSKTVLFVTFDENDGLFDHAPAPAIPSINNDGTAAGKSTLDVTGMYYKDPGGLYDDTFYARLLGKPTAYPMIAPTDTISGSRRPWGLGPRVPMYVISPWSKGGWVDSQVFDHTSVGRFIEKRFGVTIPAISPWARAVSGDLTSAFDFVSPNDPAVPALPDMGNYAAVEAASKLLPAVSAPTTPQPLFQEPGVRFSRALPYELHVTASVTPNTRTLGATPVALSFVNTGSAGAVFHVYDKLNLAAIPRRYTVEAGKRLTDLWQPAASGAYDLWVLGPNNFHRHFTGNAKKAAAAAQPNPEVTVGYDLTNKQLVVTLRNAGAMPATFSVTPNAYAPMASQTVTVVARSETRMLWPVAASGCWYDLSVTVRGSPEFVRRLAGRMETGAASVSDPASATRW